MGYCTLSENGLIMEANLTTAALLGMIRTALINQPLSRFILKDDQGIYYLHRKQLFETNPESSLLPGSFQKGQVGEPQACELRMVKMDGTTFWVELVATLSQRSDGAPECRVVISEITEHMRAEDLMKANEALRIDMIELKHIKETLCRAEENFRRSLDESPLGVRIVTADGETIYANGTILDIYGYDSMEDLKTIPVEKRYTPESYAEFLIRREKRRHGVDVQSEYTINIVRKNGDIRYLQVFRKEILWDSARQYQVIYNDLTVRRWAEEALIAERHQLAETNTALRVLLNRREEDKKEMERTISDNIQKLVLPYLKALRGLNLNARQESCLNGVEANLNQIVSPFLDNLKARFGAFTSREIQIANMIREGKTSKEIASCFNSSIRSVEFHRDNIRKKLGLNRKKTNLSTFLVNLSQK
ncbi:MAG TPA: hypothetical protein DCG53_08820 [Syntrophus sp. (in: bacteria)]|nr:hypothetical protein [Syntrophus sp. (in: bacteria)]